MIVEINSGGALVHIEVDDPDTSLDEVTTKARDLWHEVRSAGERPGGAAGISLGRSDGLDVHRDKRFGGEIAPIRAGKPPAGTSWLRSIDD